MRSYVVAVLVFSILSAGMPALSAPASEKGVAGKKADSDNDPVGSVEGVAASSPVEGLASSLAGVATGFTNELPNPLDDGIIPSSSLSTPGASDILPDLPLHRRDGILGLDNLTTSTVTSTVTTTSTETSTSTSSESAMEVLDTPAVIKRQEATGTAEGMLSPSIGINLGGTLSPTSVTTITSSVEPTTTTTTTDASESGRSLLVQIAVNESAPSANSAPTPTPPVKQQEVTATAMPTGFGTSLGPINVSIF